MDRVRGAVLVAWLNAVILGRHAPDDLTNALGGVSVGGTAASHESLAASVARWRTAGAPGAWLVVVAPGDLGALRASPSIASDVAACRWAALVPRTRDLALLLLPHHDATTPAGRIRCLEVDAEVVGQDDCRTTERHLNEQLRLSAAAVEEILEGRGRSQMEKQVATTLAPLGRLPSSLSPRAADLMERSARLSGALTLVGAEAASASSARHLSMTLLDVERTLRRAMEAAAGPTGQDR